MNSGESDMIFFIDGVQAGTFNHTPTGTSGFLFNNNVFSSQQLPLQNHTITIQNGNIGGGTSLVILDFITYR
jgi:hypothetical protein